TRNFTIEIGDKNDNYPFFDYPLYEAEVNEDVDIHQNVITVTAKDDDEYPKIRYEITDGNNGGFFAVKNESGEIYVAAALDYETKKEYELVLVATDTLHESQTIVKIHVKDINDLPPKFERRKYEIVMREEISSNLPKKMLQVHAIDPDVDRPQGMVYFITGQGADDSPPKKRKFSINATTGEIYILQPLDRDLPNGRPQWRFTVFAEDENGNGLVGYADVVVILKDINDNHPFFSNSFYTGYVTENGTAEMTVMTMTATDYDDPSEGSHARLKYSIEQNQVNEHGNLIFSIDEETGVIKTAVCCLDREMNPEYTIKVLAMDGGGLKGTGTVIIKINDVNDMPPQFTKKEVHETEGDQLPEMPILVVSVDDADLLETNKFNYKILDNTFGADKFTIVTNSDGTGSLKVTKSLDYDDVQQRYGFNLTIAVSDRGDDFRNAYHVDYAKVNIRLHNASGSKLEFEKPHIEVYVFEDVPLGSNIAKFHATHVDKLRNSNIDYKIDRTSDKKQQFEIDEHGQVRVQRTLDREDIPRYHLNIFAVNNLIPPKTATATLTIVVKDVNDNAPRFLMDYRPVIYEHIEPAKITEILATDDDDRSKGNGPPFYLKMDTNAPEEIKMFFQVQHDHNGANGDGMAVVYSKGSFDREVQKEYLVPIVIKDSGFPSMTGTSTLTVVIGDYNDNRMYSGNKHILVYICKGDTPSTSIGRVHVEDLDDWDLPDKLFFFHNHKPHPKFDLNKNTGEIKMKNTTRGSYFLRFAVFDRKHTQEVDANVTVTVKEIPEERICNSGSIRVSGITAEDFIRVWNWKLNKAENSKYDKLRKILSRLLKTNEDNVDIFSVFTQQIRPPIIDIRFSAHGAIYYNSTFLNKAVAFHRDTIAKEVDINIITVGIDECVVEGQCEGCFTNKLEIRKSPVVINANRTTFVGVNTWISARLHP
ncbi:Pt1-cadherin-like protein, partial [Leptotrombidium deliense]